MFPDEPREHMSLLQDLLLPVTGFTTAGLAFSVGSTPEHLEHAFMVGCAATLVLFIITRSQAHRHFKPIRAARKYRTLVLKRSPALRRELCTAGFKEPEFQLEVCTHEDFIRYRTLLYSGPGQWFPLTRAVFTRAPKQLRVEPFMHPFWLEPSWKRQHGSDKVLSKVNDAKAELELQWLEEQIELQANKRDEEFCCKVLPFKRTGS